MSATANKFGPASKGGRGEGLDFVIFFNVPKTLNN